VPTLAWTSASERALDPTGSAGDIEI